MVTAGYFPQIDGIFERDGGQVIRVVLVLLIEGRLLSVEGGVNSVRYTVKHSNSLL